MAYCEWMERIMDSIVINGFHFHDIEVGKEYEWSLLSGPQPLDKIEEVVCYRGQDIMTYYFLEDDHILGSDLINPAVDWVALNDNCRQVLRRIYTEQELKRYIGGSKYAKSFRPTTRYAMGLFQLILPVYNAITDIYDILWNKDIKDDVYMVRTAFKKRGVVHLYGTSTLTMPLEEWLKKNGPDEFLRQIKAKKGTDVIVMVNKKLNVKDEVCELDIPYAYSWKELM